MAKVYIGATFAVLQVLGAIRGTEYYNASDYASQHAREMARQKMLDKYRAKYRKELELSEYMESPAFSKGARIYYAQPPAKSNAVGSKIVYTDKRIDKCFTYADAPYDDSEWWYTITVTVDGKQVIKLDRAIAEVDIPAGEHTFRVDVKSHYQNDPAERLGEYKIDKEMNTKTVDKVKVEEGENFFSIYHSVTFGIDGVGTYYDKNNCYNVFVVQAPVRAKTTAYMASLELFTKRHRCDLYEYDIPFPTNEYFPEGWDEGEESQEIAEPSEPKKEKKKRAKKTRSILDDEMSDFEKKPKKERKPREKRSFSFPKIRLPRIRLPRIRLPRIRLPRLSMPSLNGADWWTLGLFLFVGVVAFLTMSGIFPVAVEGLMKAGNSLFGVAYTDFPMVKAVWSWNPDWSWLLFLIEFIIRIVGCLLCIVIELALLIVSFIGTFLLAILILLFAVVFEFSPVLATIAVLVLFIVQCARREASGGKVVLYLLALALMIAATVFIYTFLMTNF